MKRKLVRRSKCRYCRLIKLAKKNDLSLKNLLRLLKNVREIKQSDRIANRFGTEENWRAAEFSVVALTVPIVSRKDGKILSYAAYPSKDALPRDKREKYGAYFDNEE